MLFLGHQSTTKLRKRWATRSIVSRVRGNLRPSTGQSRCVSRCIIGAKIITRIEACRKTPKKSCSRPRHVRVGFYSKRRKMHFLTRTPARSASTRLNTSPGTRTSICTQAHCAHAGGPGLEAMQRPKILPHQRMNVRQRPTKSSRSDLDVGPTGATIGACGLQSPLLGLSLAVAWSRQRQPRPPRNIHARPCGAHDAEPSAQCRTRLLASSSHTCAGASAQHDRRRKGQNALM